MNECSSVTFDSEYTRVVGLGAIAKPACLSRVTFLFNNICVQANKMPTGPLFTAAQKGDVEASIVSCTNCTHTNYTRKLHTQITRTHTNYTHTNYTYTHKLHTQITHTHKTHTHSHLSK